MNEIVGLQEAFVQTFSNDPVIWGKWLIAFASFILTFVIRIKFGIDDKFDPRKKLDRKVKKAIEDKHVITATLVKQYIDYDENNRTTCGGKYEYEIDGKKRTYTAYFGEGLYPRTILHLYYEKTPKKLFTNEERQFYGISGLFMVILNFSPFIVMGITGWLLGLVSLN